MGFLGEGVNDAPALKIANAAIAVESAADISKEVSDIVLLKRDLKVKDMAKVVCTDCGAEFNIDDDAMVGEIISCPDCGLDLEVVKVEGSNFTTCG